MYDAHVMYFYNYNIFTLSSYVLSILAPVVPVPASSESRELISVEGPSSLI